MPREPAGQEGQEASVCSPSQALSSSEPQAGPASQPCVWQDLAYLLKCSNCWFLQSPSVDTVSLNLHSDPGKCTLSVPFTGVETGAHGGKVRHPGAPS